MTELQALVARIDAMPDEAVRAVMGDAIASAKRECLVAETCMAVLARRTGTLPRVATVLKLVKRTGLLDGK